MDVTRIGTYNNVLVYLIRKEGTFFLSFQTPDSHHYWLEAFNRILVNKPEYEFEAILNAGKLRVSMKDLEPLLHEVNRFVDTIS